MVVDRLKREIYKQLSPKARDRQLKRFEKLVDRIPKPLFRGGSFPKPVINRPKPVQPLPTTVVKTFQTESGDTPSSIARGFANVIRPTRTQDVEQMTPMEALAEVINNPAIQMDSDILDLVNDPSIMMDTMTGQLIQNQFAEQFRRDQVLPRTKRKVSAYQKEFGIQLKKLKKKHPRTKITMLMKRAHAATRKVRGTRKGQVRKTARRAFKK